MQAKASEILPIETRRHELVGEVGRRLAGRCGVPGGSTVVIGVSGGSDSVGLLLACVALRGRRAAIIPVAGHVNHHLRESAGEDESFVAELCRRYAVELHTRHVHPQRQAGNVAANARELRYQALTDVAASVGAPFVAVAHHAEDQLETLLMALGRGCGLDGLSAMPWSRPLEHDVQLVRPLLGVRKSGCVSLCRSAGVGWREDPTNADPSTVRGRLRRDVLGVFEDLWPDAASRAAGVADVVAAARAALDHQVREVFGEASVRCWDRVALRQLPVPVIAAGLRRAAVAAIPPVAETIGRAHLSPAAEAVVAPQRAPRSFQWPHGLVVEVTARTVRLQSWPPR